MNRTTLLNWVLPIAILLGAAAPHSHAATLTGQVVKVADGDAVTVLAQNGTRYRVRFLGIDAPEKNQAFGQDSRQNLDRLVYRKQRQRLVLPPLCEGRGPCGSQGLRGG